MNTERQIQTASIAMIALGAWVALSPLYIAVEGNALVSMMVVAALMAVFGLAQLFVRSTLPSLLGAVLGMWLIASPFVFSVSTEAMINMVIVGFVTFLVALWDGAEVNARHDTFVHTR